MNTFGEIGMIQWISRNVGTSEMNHRCNMCFRQHKVKVQGKHGNQQGTYLVLLLFLVEELSVISF
jgi:hypothetical protein